MKNEPLWRLVWTNSTRYLFVIAIIYSIPTLAGGAHFIWKSKYQAKSFVFFPNPDHPPPSVDSFERA